MFVIRTSFLFGKSLCELSVVQVTWAFKLLFCLQLPICLIFSLQLHHMAFWHIWKTEILQNNQFFSSKYWFLKPIMFQNISMSSPAGMRIISRKKAGLTSYHWTLMHFSYLLCLGEYWKLSWLSLGTGEGNAHWHNTPNQNMRNLQRVFVKWWKRIIWRK